MKLDLKTSVQMARIAKSLYESKPSPAAGVRPDLNLTDVYEYGSCRVRCIVGLWRCGSRASIVVAFRGSSNGSEWANNAHPAEWRPISPTVKGLVHPGFIGSLHDVWPSVEDRIETLTQAHM